MIKLYKHEEYNDFEHKLIIINNSKHAVFENYSKIIIV